MLHHKIEVKELRADYKLAVEYLKAALEEADNPEHRAAGLLSIICYVSVMRTY